MANFLRESLDTFLNSGINPFTKIVFFSSTLEACTDVPSHGSAYPGYHRTGPSMGDSCYKFNEIKFISHFYFYWFLGSVMTKHNDFCVYPNNLPFIMLGLNHKTNMLWFLYHQTEKSIKVNMGPELNIIQFIR